MLSNCNAWILEVFRHLVSVAYENPFDAIRVQDFLVRGASNNPMYAFICGQDFWRIDLEPAVDDLGYFRENDRKIASDIVALGLRKALLEGHSYSVWEGHGISNHLYLGRGFDPLHALLKTHCGYDKS